MSEEMGKLLLQGWAMLQETCEDCAVPLMRSRDKKQEVCCQCHKDFKGGAKKDEPNPAKNIYSKGQAAEAKQQEDLDKKDAMERLEIAKQEMLTRRRNEMRGAPQVETPVPQLQQVQAIQVQQPVVQQVQPVRVQQDQPRQTFGNENVIKCVLMKQNALCERLDRETDLSQIERLLETIGKCQDMIDRQTKH